eukprot:15437251-Alexandrium_andersonii.AAC.1
MPWTDRRRGPQGRAPLRLRRPCESPPTEGPPRRPAVAATQEEGQRAAHGAHLVPRRPGAERRAECCESSPLP